MIRPNYYKWLNFGKRLSSSRFPKLRDPANPLPPRALQNERSEIHVRLPVDVTGADSTEHHYKSRWEALDPLLLVPKTCKAQERAGRFQRSFAC